MDQYGLIWIYSGLIWSNGLIWINMDQYGLILINLDQYGSIWINFDLN